jgi:hypothetical protein
MSKNTNWVDRQTPEKWMYPGNKREFLLRNMAIVNDHLRGKTQRELAEKYFVTQGRIFQLVGGGECFQEKAVRKYVKMRREQLDMLNDYPKIWSEIMGDQRR